MPEQLDDKTKAIAEILMGAAYADGECAEEESVAVWHVLKDMLQEESMPSELAVHLELFEPEAFDLEAACAKLDLDSPEARRELLKLVAQVTEADHVHDLDESAYIVRLARCINADPEDYAGLTVKLLEFPAGPSLPPPFPGSGKTNTDDSESE